MSDLDSRQIRLRKRFRSPATTGRSPSRLRLQHAAGFLKLSLRKAHQDELLGRSAALAFVTVMSLVPLLAGLSHFSVGFFADRQTEMVQLMAGVLPYTEAAITDSLTDFFEKSRRLRGFGFIAFLLTALTAFSMIEKSINDIWDVPRRRSWRRRTSSFVLLICWGPLLIGAAYSALFFLRSRPALEPLAEALPLRLMTFVVTLIGLTMLNRQVPNTHVDFNNALLGGAVSALAIEGLRETFGLYVVAAQAKSFVYGSFGLALLFMVSIQLSWIIVLAGTEIAYCLQHFKLMSRPRRNAEVVEGSWVGLAAMVLILDRFRDREPFTPADLLAARLQISPKDLSKTLEPLIRAQLLKRHRARSEGYLLSCDPYQTPLIQLMELYETEQWDLLTALPENTAERLEALRAKLADQRRQAVGESTLAELMTNPEEDAAGPPEPSP